MKKNRTSFEGFYIATLIYDIGELIEPWEQYETLGQIDHHVIITPQKRLLYLIIDREGNRRFFDYETNKEVTEYSKSSSYSTNASCYSSLYYGYTQGQMIMPIEGLASQMKAEARKKFQPQYGYFIPAEEYFIDKGIKKEKLDLKTILKLLARENKKAKKIKNYELSFDEEEALSQLRTNLCRSIKKRQ